MQRNRSMRARAAVRQAGPRIDPTWGGNREHVTTLDCGEKLIFAGKNLAPADGETVWCRVHRTEAVTLAAVKK